VHSADLCATKHWGPWLCPPQRVPTHTHTHAHSSLAVTLMCLNVVCEVEGGLRYWSGIEWWMMQCPYVILKTFRARSVGMTAPWNIALSPPPLLIPPCALSWNVESVSPTLEPLFPPLAFCFFYQHVFLATLQPFCCCIFFTFDFDKVMSNSHLSEPVDRLATGGNWICCDRVLTGLWSHAPQKPSAHQLLSFQPAFLMVPGDLSEERGEITHCKKENLVFLHRDHLRNMRLQR